MRLYGCACGRDAPGARAYMIPDAFSNQRIRCEGTKLYPHLGTSKLHQGRTSGAVRTGRRRYFRCCGASNLETWSGLTHVVFDWGCRHCPSRPLTTTGSAACIIAAAYMVRQRHAGITVITTVPSLLALMIVTLHSLWQICRHFVVHVCGVR